MSHHLIAVKECTKAFAPMPSGLGHYDQALYLLLGRQLEESPGSGPVWALDFGTFFGHSAFALLLGGSKASRNPRTHVLTLDIFQQPEWLLQQPHVKVFTERFAGSDGAAVRRWLDDLCARCGLPKDNISVRTQDVMELRAEDLQAVAENGFPLVSIDCAKSPELMNKIAELVLDQRVTPLGATLVFQDFFDWHAPWNAYAFAKMIDKGYATIRNIAPHLGPLLEVKRHGDMGPVCQTSGTGPIEEDWCRPFAPLEDELQTLDRLVSLLEETGDVGSARRLECLKVGAWLRGNKVAEAEALLGELDAKWPTHLSDSPLQNAFRRIEHVKTGHKDLTLIFDTPHRTSRTAVAARMGRRIWQRAAMIRPFALKPVSARLTTSR